MRRRLSLRVVAVATLLLQLTTGCGGARSPVRVGIITACTGVFAQETPSYIAGAELPLLQRGGKSTGLTPSDGVKGATLAGRPVELEVSCADPLNPSSALDQLRRLVETKHVDAVVGPTHEPDRIVARYARKHPHVVFMLTSYDQASTLRSAARNVFRFELDGAQWSAGLAAYAYHRMGWRHVTTVGEGDPPGWVQAAGFDAEFCALGGHVQRLWATDPQNLAGLVRLVSRTANGVFLDPMNFDASGFVTEWRRRNHDLGRRLVLGPYVPLGRLRLPSVVTVSPGPWGQTKAKNAYDKAFAQHFPSSLGLDPNNLAVIYYDEVEPLLEALQNVHGNTSGGERALRRALARLHYASPEGPIHLDKRHQAVGPTYLARIEPTGYKQLKVVPGVDQTFGGYFIRHRTPPGPHSPGCFTGKPPPWAVQQTR
jgi:ABC-type branched-subunit amino acid transport system substrate-binding protein